MQLQDDQASRDPVSLLGYGMWGGSPYGRIPTTTRWKARATRQARFKKALTSRILIY